MRRALPRYGSFDSRWKTNSSTKLLPVRGQITRSKLHFPTSAVYAGWMQTEQEVIGFVSICLSALLMSKFASGEGRRGLSREEVGKPRGALKAGLDLDWGVCDDMGPRECMEDTYQVMKGRDHIFASVYDGHGGSGSSQYLRSNFYGFISSVLMKNRRLLSDATVTVDELHDITKNLFTDVFETADSALIDHIASLGDPECWSGSTATMCLVGSLRLTCANVGDSKAVLCRAGKPIELSVDHRPTTLTTSGRGEIKRVVEAGGWVSQSRVCGVLAVTRALGDYEFKGGRFELLAELQDMDDRQAATATMQTPPVISIPHCVTLARSSEDEFLILATDGLWDTMNGAQAVTFVRTELKKTPDKSMQAVADALVARALRCRTQDNVACIVIKLNK
ncbi:Protein phosphatase 2C [Ostreococcus tauri]|uniref:protein-serine/threonine phosphatase n=1 Tax=Ostreococcus tauri TaxID=70448 RepID=Q01EE0_OSTTA|nr:Protein phosphatase 2C [Ostreococcus tauri]CAL52313.1 Protein phosphatase 2C [Ostreococcus tauri]|eukprot:XP_003075041.1 Protein phosphatase 2C [Ostreococcus tauri]